MNHSITFLAFFIPVVINLTDQGICPYAKNSNAERFKKKSKGLQIVYQIIWPDPQCGSGN